MEKDFEYFIRQANRDIQMCEEKGHNELKEYVASLLSRNEELEKETCAWALVVRWAIECGLTLDQVVSDEDMDNFFQEMDEKDMDYLYGFLEYAKKCIKEGKA